jgi:hypothetical protein
MCGFRQWALVLLWAGAMAEGQPALTTIQDILYRADGTRYNGTIFIKWNSFQGGDASNIATADLALPIVNGSLKVQLVPTTNASPGAQYNVTYNGKGKNLFTEVWAVPPSDVPLRVRDVRIATGTVVGPPPVTTQIQISDVAGLTNELAVRPMKGVGYAIGRAAGINQAGQIDGVPGNLSDCVRVDGSSGPCGTGGGVVPSFSDGEVPAGIVNGSNTVFSLSFAPSPAASLDLFRNGLLMKQGVDYTLSGHTITFFLASTPQAGDLLLASYRYANPNNPLGTLSPAEVICSSVGSSTSSTSLVSLGSCTIPAGLLGTGDRIEVQYQYSHTGSTTGFTGEIHWDTTTVISRSTASAETALAGRITFGIYAGAQSWDTQSWGSALVFAAGVGSAGADTSQALTIDFRGGMSGTTSDSVNLRNFTVVRYPAQTNP